MVDISLTESLFFGNSYVRWRKPHLTSSDLGQGNVGYSDKYNYRRDSLSFLCVSRVITSLWKESSTVADRKSTNSIVSTLSLHRPHLIHTFLIERVISVVYLLGTGNGVLWIHQRCRTRKWDSERKSGRNHGRTHKDGVCVSPYVYTGRYGGDGYQMRQLDWSLFGPVNVSFLGPYPNVNECLSWRTETLMCVFGRYPCGVKSGFLWGLV